MTRKNRAGKYKDRAACAALAICAALSLTACAGEAAGQDAAAAQTEENPAAEQGGQTASADWEADWPAQRAALDRRTSQDRRTEPQNEDQATQIRLDEYGEQVILTESGDIRLTGSLEGQVVIDAQEDELVHLYLEGVEIASPKGPAIRIIGASKVIVTLVSDTENVLTDSPDYTDCEDTPACLYSVCDLTINGDGGLFVSAYHEDGIRSKDRIKLLGGTISVQAKGDGIRGNDGIYMQDARVDIESEKNGLRTVNTGVDDRGVIEMNGGTLSVVAGRDGIRAASDIYLYHGTCTVNAVEERIRAEGTAYIEE